LILATCFALTPAAWATEPADAPSVKVRLLDLPLSDQDGHSLRFASEAVGKSVVAINFVYTSCTTLCPLTSATFKNVQSRLKNRLGKDVRLISMSLDPVTDTPARLKAYAARYKAGPGWLWLTGEPGNMKQVLTGLGAYTASIQEHPPQVLVGDGASGQWTRFNTLPGPDRIRAAVEQYLKARHD
jgi:protein SCO1/2